MTLGCSLCSRAIFLSGFKEAIGVAVLLVIAYLCLNAVVAGRACI